MVISLKGTVIPRVVKRSENSVQILNQIAVIFSAMEQISAVFKVSR